MMTDYSAMAFPKSSWGKQKKKRKKHRESIIQKKGDKRCLLCMLLDNDYREHAYTEEHHIVFGKPGRALSEEYGLTCRLCLKHHRDGVEAVHNNKENADFLKRLAQKRFTQEYPSLNWLEIFGKNYL